MSTKAKSHRDNLRANRDLRADMKAKLLVVLFLTCTSTLFAQMKADGEIVVGPTLATVGGGESIKRYGGLGLGVAANIHLLEYGVGSLMLTVPPMIVFGPTTDTGSVFDIQRFHLPIGLMLSVGDEVEDGGITLGGGVTLGYGLMFGAFTEDIADHRPFMSFDVILGIFKKGALKLRYTTVIGEYDFFDQGNVGYHGFFVVGSTAW